MPCRCALRLLSPVGHKLAPQQTAACTPNMLPITHIRQAHSQVLLILQVLVLVHDIPRWTSAPEEAVQKPSLEGLRLLLLLRKHKSSPTRPSAQTQKVRCIAARESFIRRGVVCLCPPSHGTEHVSATMRKAATPPGCVCLPPVVVCTPMKRGQRGTMS